MLQAEHEDRFPEFGRARWSHLVRTAYLLTGDAHHAEDLTRTAPAKAYRSWRRVARADNPEAYVRRMPVSCNSDRFLPHSRLQPKQRVVVMRYWEDLSEAEVAEVLGRSVGTVTSQVSKGLAKSRTVPGLAWVAEGQGGSKQVRDGTGRRTGVGAPEPVMMGAVSSAGS